jgi:hypothetical protein
MTITTEPLAGLTIDELDHLTSSIGTDTITWSDPNYVVNPFGTYNSPVTFGPNVSGSHTVLGGTGYTYTTNTTGPWVGAGGTGSSPTVAVNPSGTIDLRGEGADIKINGKSMVTWMEKVEERLNILTPNPELEKDWDELRRLGNRYRALEKKCMEKAQMWATLKKVQPKQP